MTTELAVKDRSSGPLLGRARRFVFGPPLPARMPWRGIPCDSGGIRRGAGKAGPESEPAPKRPRGRPRKEQ